MRLTRFAALPAVLSFFKLAHTLAHDGSQVVLGQDSNVEAADIIDGPQQRLIETAPGEARWMSEADKWDLKQQGIDFFDLTHNPQLGDLARVKDAKTVEYPKKPAYNDTLYPLLAHLKKENMRKNLEHFTSYFNRYYTSDTGKESAEWLAGQIRGMFADAGLLEKGGSVKMFKHHWAQSSIIAEIPGKSNKTVILSAHEDSINMFFNLFPAPGADDDGSGTVTILEGLRVLLKSPEIVAGKAENTIQFHWYSAEEAGLLGSSAIFTEYKRTGVDVVAMLHQDMTGYIRKTIAAGEPESMGIITDNVSPSLTAFVGKIINQYCALPIVYSKCGYACSDHASGTKAGYPTAMVTESDFKYFDPNIHTSDDTIEYLNFDHMLQHARLVVAFAYELGFAKL